MFGKCVYTCKKLFTYINALHRGQTENWLPGSSPTIVMLITPFDQTKHVTSSSLLPSPLSIRSRRLAMSELDVCEGVLGFKVSGCWSSSHHVEFNRKLNIHQYNDGSPTSGIHDIHVDVDCFQPLPLHFSFLYYFDSLGWNYVRDYLEQCPLIILQCSWILVSNLTHAHTHTKQTYLDALTNHDFCCVNACPSKKIPTLLHSWASPGQT